VDDATAGADSMDRLKALSGEMEAVAKRGGFEFKETLRERQGGREWRAVQGAGTDLGDGG
jgi:hypothetical protein